MNSEDKCETLVHEYTHAIGDQVFGDSDKDHTKYKEIYDHYEKSYCLKALS